MGITLNDVARVGMAIEQRQDSTGNKDALKTEMKEAKSMLGDMNKELSVYEHMISGSGLPLNRMSEAYRKRLGADQEKSARNQAYINLLRFAYRPKIEECTDEWLRGYLRTSKRVPDKLAGEYKHRKEVAIAREKATLEAFKNPDPLVKEWMEQLGLDLQNFHTPVLNRFQIDREGRIPPEVFQVGLDAKLNAIGIPTEYGGLGFIQQEVNGVLDFLPEGGGAVGATWSAHKSIGIAPLKKKGTTAQKRVLIPMIANGDKEGKKFLCAFGLTERGAGTNAIKQQKTEARLSEDGKYWIINADDKIFHTNLHSVGGLLYLSANVIRKDGKKLPSVFLVPLPFRLGDSKQETQNKIDKLWEQGFQLPDESMSFMGINGSNQATYGLVNFKLPVTMDFGTGEEIDTVLGGTEGIGKGPEAIFGGLNEGRDGFMRFCTATIGFALDIILEDIVQNERFPNLPFEPIPFEGGELKGTVANMPNVQSIISEVAMNYEALKAMSELSSSMIDNYPEMNIIPEAAIGKAYASDLAWDSVEKLTRLAGGKGLMKGNLLELILRDLRITLLVEGVNPAMYQHGAGDAAKRALAMSKTFLGKLKIAKNQEPFMDPFLERGDLNVLEAASMHLKTKGLSIPTLLKGAIYGNKMMLKQDDLINTSKRAAVIYARAASMLKLKRTDLPNKTRAALERFVKNTSPNPFTKVKYPTRIGELYIKDAASKVLERQKEDAKLLRKYG